jgi:hypothetical protein
MLPLLTLAGLPKPCSVRCAFSPGHAPLASDSLNTVGRLAYTTNVRGTAVPAYRNAVQTLNAARATTPEQESSLAVSALSMAGTAPRLPMHATGQTHNARLWS